MTEDKTIADVELEQEVHPLHLLQKAIAAMPAIDQEKVQAVIKKLESGELQILGTAEERLEAAKRIAAEITDEYRQR